MDAILEVIIWAFMRMTRSQPTCYKPRFSNLIQISLLRLWEAHDETVNKQLLFLEPGRLPNESDEETVQRLAAVLRSKGFQIIENRKISHEEEQFSF